MTTEDGEEIKLTILEKPIPLDSLEFEDEKNFKNCLQNTSQKVFNTRIDLKKRILKKKLFKESDVKIGYLTFLKEPISLDDIQWNDDTKEEQSSITFNVKTVQGFVYGNRKRGKDTEYHTWKRNALVIFEHSFVYPFAHVGGKYTCFVCSKPFLDARVLQNHTINEHDINEMKQELNNRVRVESLKVDITRLQCKICLHTLPNLDTLKTHLKDHGKLIEPDFQDNLIPFKLGRDEFNCQICGEHYAKLRLLVIHMSKHFNNYNCEICGSVFISLHLLRRHQNTHELGSYPCDKCDKIFNTSAKRTLHTRGVHLKHFPRRCPICLERFNSNYQRTKHLRVVHNQTAGLFRCDVCGREYDLKNHLSIHIRSVHLQERNHECSFCHSRFFTKYSLSRHMVIHTGEKNFKCGVCGKAYARKTKLTEHCKTHDVGICSVCGQNCGDRENLVIHISSVHGVL